MNREKDNIKQCEEGEIFYRVSKDKITEVTIEKVTHHIPMGHYSYKDNEGRSYFGHSFGRTLFKTRGDAVREVQKANLIKTKRERLKDYERQLNAELGLVEHFIVK